MSVLFTNRQSESSERTSDSESLLSSPLSQCSPMRSNNFSTVVYFTIFTLLNYFCEHGVSVSIKLRFKFLQTTTFFLNKKTSEFGLKSVHSMLYVFFSHQNHQQIGKSRFVGDYHFFSIFKSVRVWVLIQIIEMNFFSPAQMTEESLLRF